MKLDLWTILTVAAISLVTQAVVNNSSTLSALVGRRG